jgi:hypothetical protein
MTPVVPNLLTFFAYISTENELEYVVENEVASSTIRQELKRLAVVHRSLLFIDLMQ